MIPRSPKRTKRVMGKAERRARLAGPRSEFIIMCEHIAAAEALRFERFEREREAREWQVRRKETLGRVAA
jgi:hypothetical protein